MERLFKEVKEKEGYLIVREDFNARTGSEWGPIETGGMREEQMRRLKDKVITQEERILIRKIRERGWIIMNGCYKRRGEWTYIEEVGTSVIDYVVTNEKTMVVIKEIKEEDRTESNQGLISNI